VYKCELSNKTDEYQGPLVMVINSVAILAYRAVPRVHRASGVRRNFVRGFSTNSVENRGQREWESGGGSPLVRGSGGSCNLVQEISFHIVKFS